MVIRHQKRCKLFFLITTILETVGVIFVVLQVSSICVKAGEINITVVVFLFLVPVAMICDAVFFILMLRLRTLGVDPVAVMYNFVVGLTCILGGIAALLVALKLCGSSSQLMVIIGGALAIAAGVIHLINGCYCHRKLSPGEREWPPRREARSKSRSRSVSRSVSRSRSRSTTPERGIMKKPADKKKSPEPKKKSPTPPKKQKAGKAAQPKAKKTPCWKKCKICGGKKRQKTPTPPSSPKTSLKATLKKDPWSICRSLLHKKDDPCKGGKKAPTPPPSPKSSRKRTPPGSPKPKKVKETKVKETKVKETKVKEKKVKEKKVKAKKVRTPPSSPMSRKKVMNSLAKKVPWCKCREWCQKKEDPCKGKGKPATPPPSPGPSKKAKPVKVKKEKVKREKSKTPPPRAKSPTPVKEKGTKGKSRKLPPCPKPGGKLALGVSCRSMLAKFKKKIPPLPSYRSKTPTECPKPKKGKKVKVNKPPPSPKAKTPPPSPKPTKKTKQPVAEKTPWCKCREWCKRKEDPCKGKQKPATPPPSPKATKTKKVKKQKVRTPTPSPKPSKTSVPKQGSPWWKCQAMLDKLKKKDDPCTKTKGKAATPPASPGPSRCCRRRTPSPSPKATKKVKTPKVKPQKEKCDKQGRPVKK